MPSRIRHAVTAAAIGLDDSPAGSGFERNEMELRFVRTVIWSCVSLCVATSSPQGFSAEDSQSWLLAGAHAQEITPPKFPISVNGNMADQLATGAHDPLHARCIVVKEKKSATQPDTAIAIVVCDSCMIPRHLLDRAKELASKKTGIPGSNILISATHAHSCPTLTGVFQSDPDADYVEFLIEQIAKGIERANSQLEPARVGWGSIDQPNLVFNRRWLLKEGETTEDPFGGKSDRVQTNPGFGNLKVTQSQNVIDPELSVLSIQSKDGRPIALLANYSLHYVGGVAGNVVSSDYFGEFSQRVARQLKATDVQPPFVGIMSNGTSGDINNVDFRQKSVPAREPFEQIQFVAETLAADAALVYKKIEYQSALPVKALETEIVLNARQPTADELNAAEAKIAAIPDRPLKGLPAIYARETTLLAEYPASVKARIQVMRIGSLAIVSSPCETFAETGLAIKKGSPFKQTFTIELANGYNGYLPPPEQLRLGGYETWRARSSYLSSDAEPKVRATMLQLLSELNK